jgi:hypothetical protein
MSLNRMISAILESVIVPLLRATEMIGRITPRHDLENTDVYIQIGSTGYCPGKSSLSGTPYSDPDE